MDLLLSFLPDLTEREWTIHIAIFLANITLFLLARPVLALIDPNGVNDRKVRLFQAVNVLVFILHVADILMLRISDFYQNYFINIGYSLMAIYGALLLYTFLAVLTRRRFGKEKQVDNQTIYLDTYSTRLVELLLLAFIVLSTVYILIKIWGADSLLETTGIFGILIAFLAFTSNIWAPDLVSGLIILNTEILEDGDVVILEGHANEYVIARVTLIYIVLYDIRNNHRTLMRNSKFMGARIDNLSRVASTDGIRQAIVYKIGYPEVKGDREARVKALSDFQQTVSDMFQEAFKACCDSENICVNKNQPFDWALTRTGDYALEYTLWVYLQRLPNTKVTSTLRRHLMGTLYKVNEAVYTASVAYNIDLSTPDLVIETNQTKVQLSKA